MKQEKIKNFLDIETVPLEKSQVAIIPFGFEATTTYGQGADLGPEAILQASSQVELFDEELWQETNQKIAIATLPVKKPTKNILLAKKQLSGEVAKVLKLKKIPITLGGEHSITPFIIEAYKKFGFGEFSILHFDAHADLRDGYLGQKYSHAAAMRRCLDFDGINLVQIGIRNISNENDELVFWKSNQAKIKTFGVKDKKSWQLEEIIKFLKKDVYISFDVDALDPSIMPSTGTPEPGGLDWFETIDILRAVCQQRNIIGADFVELAPIKNFNAPDFLVAKLIYKTIGYIFKIKN
jgi:agmatinase